MNDTYYCASCDVDHPPLYECRAHEWMAFFKDHDKPLMAHDYPECGPGSVNIEEMYQAFKLRLMHEIAPQTWDHSGPHVGNLIERKS